MSVLINKNILTRIVAASAVGTALPLAFYNFIATGEFGVSLQYLVFIGLNYLIGLSIIYCLLKSLSLFRFWLFFLFSWFVFYVVVAAYSFSMGYGEGALLFPLLLSIFSMPSIWVTWFILKSSDSEIN